MSGTANNQGVPGQHDSSISSYFEQSSSSIFDQLTPGSHTELNSRQTMESVGSNNNSSKDDLPPLQVSSSFVTPQRSSSQLSIQSTSNLQFAGSSNTEPSIMESSSSPTQQRFSLLPPYQTSSSYSLADGSLQTVTCQLASPQPAVLTPGGITHPNSQFSTPFKEVDSAQAALLSQRAGAVDHSGYLTPQKMAGLTNAPPSIGLVSPNTSVDVESTIVKFSQTSLEDQLDDTTGGPSTQTAVPPKTLIPISLSSGSKPMSGTNQIALDVPDRSKPIDPNIYKYFPHSKVSNTFESSKNKNQSSTSLNESAMMNPVYMSPTESFNLSTAIPSPDSFLTPATEQDVFTASLLSSDADRRHDAWIPSESTKTAFIAMASCPPGTYFPEKELLTMPGIAVKEDFGDPVKNLVRTYLGEEIASKRQILTSSSVTQDDRGLRQLIANGCYHAAVNLTTQLLTVYQQGEGRAGHPSKHTAHSIQLWFTRIALLVKLRRFSLAEVECQYFGDLDAPDLYFQFYPELYGGRKGSMVPFSFRLLVAELPQYLGKHTRALDRLNVLLRTCDKIVTNMTNGMSEDASFKMAAGMREDSLKLWRNRRLRVMYTITSCAVGLKDFRLAGSLLRRLLQEDSTSIAGLYSALGRLCLQLGDIEAAQETFRLHLEHAPAPPRHDPVQGLVHSAYIACAQNNYKDACEILRQAHKINPNNGLVVNNLGVCLMYMGEVREAIRVVEGAVFSQPDKFLHEAVILNLASMYELESSNTHNNKLKLLALVSQHKGDSFSVSALKLQPQ